MQLVDQIFDPAVELIKRPTRTKKCQEDGPAAEVLKSVLVAYNGRRREWPFLNAARVAEVALLTVSLTIRGSVPT